MPLFSERSDKTREVNISISHLLLTLAFAALSGVPLVQGLAVCSPEGIKSRMSSAIRMIACSEMLVTVSRMTVLRPKVSMCRCEGSHFSSPAAV